jgi:DeoR/GlpR family transcriptional regulator of sugar metabolism
MLTTQVLFQFNTPSEDLAEVEKKLCALREKLALQETALHSTKFTKVDLNKMLQSKLFHVIVRLRGLQRQLQNVLRAHKHAYQQNSGHIHQHLGEFYLMLII